MNLASHFTGVGGAIVLALIAFSVVFIVLAGLSLIIAGLQHFTKAIESMAAAKKAAPAPAAKKAAPAKAVSVCGDNKEQIVAVITAAIAAAAPGSRITGIRSVLNVRKEYTRGWKTHGRLDNLEGFEA